MTDLIFGAADNYRWEQIAPWAKSIRECGFAGKVLLLVYRGDLDRIFEECDKLNIDAFVVEHDNHGQPIRHNYRNRDTQCHQMRFFHFWQYFTFQENINDYRFVVATDVRDVVFQQDPTKWLLDRIGERGNTIVAPSENIHYKNEPWGADNMIQGFGPIVMEAAKDWEIFNVGTIAGHAGAMKGLSLVDYMMGENRYIPNDQSGFNLLVNSGLMNVSIARHDDAWAMQVGTTLDPDKSGRYKPHWIQPPGFIDENGVAYSSPSARKFVILHQWDRIPWVKDVITKRYGVYGQLLPRQRNAS